ncbi:hypothetical protein E2562_018027 [Oryza meyeriana var. granulata]|uniref:RNase H type-1 domain-containing protein n=1 Tax=Oryza meyeriana var. granulata TaxID=110450 RepID=A0A6G1C825_9ORYZ|nr:hypothetical protein E2562_018027 [Oryza meyeriana var. granulata]
MEEVWTAHTDGTCNATGAGAAAVISSPTTRKAIFAAKLEFPATNNIAKYEAILLALCKARAMGVLRIIIGTDSQVAAGHIDKSCQAWNPELVKYLAAFRWAETHFRGVTVAGTPHANIADADALAKAVATNTPLAPHVMYEVLSTPTARPSDTPPSTVAVIDTTPDWRALIIDILTGRAEALARMEERRLCQRARGYVLVE